MFCVKFFLRVCLEIICFCGETNNEKLSIFVLERSEDVAGENQLKGEMLVTFLYFRRGNFLRFVISNRRAHYESVAIAHSSMDCVVHFIAGQDRDKVRALRWIEIHWTGNQNNIVSRFEGRFGDGVAHFSRGTIRDVTNRIDRLGRRASSDQEFQATKLS